MIRIRLKGHTVSRGKRFLSYLIPSIRSRAVTSIMSLILFPTRTVSSSTSGQFPGQSSHPHRVVKIMSKVYAIKSDQSVEVTPSHCRVGHSYTEEKQHNPERNFVPCRGPHSFTLPTFFGFLIAPAVVHSENPLRSFISILLRTPRTPHVNSHSPPIKFSCRPRGQSQWC